MENKHIRIVLLLMALWLLLPSCEIADIRSMFISYGSVEQRFDQSMQWNADNQYQEIVVPDDSYVIFSMSDSHTGTTGNLSLFFDNAVTDNSVAAVLAGDLTTGHPEDYDTFHRHLPAPGTIPCFPIAGNHDLYFNGWEQFYTRFGSSTYLFTVQTPAATDLFICLDTGGGTLGSKQMKWLADILETERSGYRHCLLFTHNNLFRLRHSWTTNPPVEELQRIIELSIRHHVDMIITGHDHKSSVKQFGNTTHIVMDPLLDGCSHAGYLKLIMNDEEVKYKLINF